MVDKLNSEGAKRVAETLKCQWLHTVASFCVLYTFATSPHVHQLAKTPITFAAHLNYTQGQVEVLALNSKNDIMQASHTIRSVSILFWAKWNNLQVHIFDKNLLIHQQFS